MTRYYYYIKAGLVLDSQTTFYQVAVGEGQQGRRQNAWLEAYSIEHGHFFIRQTVSADDFIWKALLSVDKDIKDIVPINAKDLINSLKTGCDDPAVWQAIQHRHELLMEIDSHYFAYYQISK